MSETLLEPIELTDAELDLVTGGQIQVGNLVAVDVSNNNVQVAIPVNAAVAVNVLGEATGALATQPGRIF